MPVLVKKSFAWIWMFALLTATVGISVHQIYCYCAGMRSVSLFSAVDTCSAEKQAAAPSCCSKKVVTKRSCCEKEGADAQKEPGCTKKTTQVFKLTAKFIFHETQVNDVDFALFDLPEAPAFIRHPAVAVISQRVGIQAFPNPPPPLSGRAICVRHCLALC